MTPFSLNHPVDIMEEQAIVSFTVRRVAILRPPICCYSVPILQQIIIR